MQLDPAVVDECVSRALREDLGGGVDCQQDLTGQLVVPPSAKTAAEVRCKQEGVLAGIPVALACVRAVGAASGGAGLQAEPARADGDLVREGEVVMRVTGPARAMLVAERTLLNFLQRLSGVATSTRRFVDAVAGTGARIFDTRKTTPGLRALEKYAVRIGGGCNHRFGLDDQVLLKENHFALARPLGYEAVVRRCVEAARGPVIAEARTREEAVSAVRGGAAVVMLDNFPLGAALSAAVSAVRAEGRRCGRTVEVEVSGGMRLENVRAFAECGVDRISVGALTHSAGALDISMKVEGAS